MPEILTILKFQLPPLVLAIVFYLIAVYICKIKQIFNRPLPVPSSSMNHVRNIMDRYNLRRRTPATDRTVQDLNIIEFNRDNFCEQYESPLFSVLPGEIRDRIFAYTLAEFDDTSTAFDSNTCYRRPEYAAPRRSDTALLQTCQRVYHEAFFYPFALAEQILWLAWTSRRPSTVTTVERLRPSLALMQKLHGDTELDSVRVFAQLCSLESGGPLSEVLDMPHFLPRSMTITIRHTDIWSWESDSPISIGGHWTEICRFPSSLRCLNVQVESLERRKDQVDYIAEQMIDKWRFTRSDDTTLQAAPNSTTITRWSGSSTWENERWLRDETSPETLDYYVATISFHPVSTEEIRNRPHLGDPQLGPMPGAVPLQHPSPSVTTHELAQAHVPAGLSGDEVLAIFDSYRREQMTAQATRMTEAARLRQERLQATQSTRRAARRARAQAEITSAYPHRESGDIQVAPLVVVSADTLRAARAARRLARRAEGEEGWMTVGGSGSGSGKRERGGTLIKIDEDGDLDADAAASSGLEMKVVMDTE